MRGGEPLLTRARDPRSLIAAVSVGNSIGVMPGSIAAFWVGGLMDSRGFSEVAAGAISTAEIVAVAITSVLVAPFMPRLPIRGVAIGGVLLASGAQFGSTLIESPWLLGAVRLLAGVGAGLALAAGNTSGAAAKDPDRLYGYAISILLVFVAVTSYGLAAVMAQAGVEGGFVMIGALYLLGLTFLRGLRPAPGATASAVGGALPRRELVLLIGTIVLVGFATGPTWSFMERVGVRMGLELERVGFFYLIATCVGILGPVLAGVLGGRFGRTRPIAIAQVGLGLSCVVIVHAQGEATYFAGMVGLLITYMFLYPFVLATIACFDPAGRVGPAAAGLFFFVLGLGPFLGGLLVTHGSYATPGWFGMGILGAAALLLTLCGGSLDRLAGAAAESKGGNP